jgi:hypothetical protein
VDAGNGKECADVKLRGQSWAQEVYTNLTDFNF